MLKHWESPMMPQNEYEGILFLDDAQGVGSLDALTSTFQGWASALSPGVSGWQFGYPNDKSWWSNMDDPVGEQGNHFLSEINGTKALIWVDFTVQDVFPPE